LHPQQRISSTENTESKSKNKTKVFQKRFARNKRSSYLCSPLKREVFKEVLRYIEWVFRRRKTKINFQIFSSKSLPVKKEFSTFAPALRNKRHE
jgi:hypothetical protein